MRLVEVSVQFEGAPLCERQLPSYRYVTEASAACSSELFSVTPARLFSGPALPHSVSDSAAKPFASAAAPGEARVRHRIGLFEPNASSQNHAR